MTLVAIVDEEVLGRREATEPDPIVVAELAFGAMVLVALEALDARVGLDLRLLDLPLLLKVPLAAAGLRGSCSFAVEPAMGELAFCSRKHWLHF